MTELKPNVVKFLMLRQLRTEHPELPIRYLLDKLSREIRRA